MKLVHTSTPNHTIENNDSGDKMIKNKRYKGIATKCDHTHNQTTHRTNFTRIKVELIQTTTIVTKK